MRKDWYKSKTVWAGVFLIIGSIGLAMIGKTDQSYQMFFTGLGLIGLRQAVE